MLVNPTDALTRAENDQSRSEFVRQLVQGAQSGPLGYSKPSIPRVIIQYWDDLKSLPSDVAECINSWRRLTENRFTHILFDDALSQHFIANNFDGRYLEAFERCYHPAMRCDYFRLCYLLREGGFYVDADEAYEGAALEPFFEDDRLKLQPLCYDISSEQMVELERFVSGTENSPDWIFYFNNNPIISPANHAVIGLALERATNLLLGPENELEIQSTTGPGNLTASIVYFFLSREQLQASRMFQVITAWERISISRWPLSYRNDSRNWRIGAKANSLSRSTNTVDT